MAVAFSLLFNFAAAVIFVATYLIMVQVVTISVQAYIFGFGVVCIFACFIFDRWLRSSGCKRFDNLS